jgi:hypothetical protein
MPKPIKYKMASDVMITGEIVSVLKVIIPDNGSDNTGVG